MLVPISWQYDPWDKGRLDGIVATTDTPIIDLVSNGEHYRLPPPQLEDEGGESFYVVVDGDAKARSLEIAFDGVTQTVNLATGKTDEGEAAALYDIGDDALAKKPCDDAQWFDSDTVVAEFSCDLFGPVLTPYAAGEWAPEGSLWLALTVQTDMRVYGETDGLGGGARYTATRVKVKPEIDGEAPAEVLSTEDIGRCLPGRRARSLRVEQAPDLRGAGRRRRAGTARPGSGLRLARPITWGDYDPPRKVQGRGGRRRSAPGRLSSSATTDSPASTSREGGAERRQPDPQAVRRAEVRDHSPLPQLGGDPAEVRVVEHDVAAADGRVARRGDDGRRTAPAGRRPPRPRTRSGRPTSRVRRACRPRRSRASMSRIGSIPTIGGVPLISCRMPSAGW